MRLPSLPEIEQQVRSLARQIGATDHDLPTFGRSEGFARPHIEVDVIGLHYVVEERGEERKRVTTYNLDEFLRLIFEHITFLLACSFELKNRVSGQDFRRVMFEKQVELLGVLSTMWADHETRNHQEILARHPFDDASGERASLAATLRKSGESPDAAWRNACERYPLPVPEID